MTARPSRHARRGRRAAGGLRVSAGRQSDNAAVEWELAAWHESGHAVAQAVANLPLHDAAIWWEPARRLTGRWWKASGHVRPTQDGRYLASDADVEGTDATIVAALAGPEAEARRRHEITGMPLPEARRHEQQNNAGGDLRDVADYMRHTPLTWAEANARAITLVADWWPAIRRVARLLQSDGTVAGDQIRAVISARVAPVRTRNRASGSTTTPGVSVWAAQLTAGLNPHADVRQVTCVGEAERADGLAGVHGTGLRSRRRTPPARPPRTL